MIRAPHASRAAAPTLLLLLCLFTPNASSVAQSPAPPAQAQPPAPLVKLGVVVTDESGRPVADVRGEEISLLADGTPQKIVHFAREGTPVSYGLLLDGSRSVGPLLDTIRRTGATIASGNNPGDETFILRFVDSDKIEMMQDFTSDPSLLAQALSRLYVELGQTAVIDATYVAARKVAERRRDETGRRRALVLISDCEDRSSVYKDSELVKLLRREGVEVFVIAFTDKLSDERGFIRKSPQEKAVKLAELVAKESGGRAFFPKNMDELIKVAEEISRDLRSQYVLSYAPTHAGADGRSHKLEIKIAEAPGRAKRRAVVRPGRFAGK